MAKLLKRKIVMHCHGSNFDKFHDKSALNAFFIKWVLDHSDVILVLSKSWKKTIGSYTHNQKIKILYNPVIFDNFEDCHLSSINEYSHKILFMGRIGKRKGVYDILDAIPKILVGFPDAKFIFAGDGEIDKAKKMVIEKGIQSNVEFVGWVRGCLKKDYFKNADIYILPSYNEGIPVSVIEAMAAGLPVVSTNVGGIPDAVSDNINGYLIEAGDITALTEKVTHLLEYTKIRNQMGISNRKKAMEMFDIKKIIPQLLEIYNSV